MKLSIAVKKIGVAVAFALLLTLVSLQPTAPVAGAQSGGEFEGALFDVIPDPTPTSVIPGNTVASTFYLQGKMYRFRAVNQATCSLIDPAERVLGVWYAWGEVAPNGRLVIHHTFHLTTYNGAFEAQGITGISLANSAAAPAVVGTTGGPSTGPTEALAVTGGSGTYKGIDGQINVRPYCGPASFVNAVEPLPAFKYDRAFCVGFEASKRSRRIFE